MGRGIGGVMVNEFCNRREGGRHTYYLAIFENFEPSILEEVVMEICPKGTVLLKHKDKLGQRSCNTGFHV